MKDKKINKSVAIRPSVLKLIPRKPFESLSSALERLILSSQKKA